MTATLVRKGQSVETTTEAFRVLTEHGIVPMPMLMHHDSQPLVSRGTAHGLLNQVRLLRRAGAVGMQVLMITPAPGSKLYEEAFTSGLAYDSAAGRMVEPRMMDGNFVVASKHAKPWRKQFNLLAAYLYFYNPLRFMGGLVRPRQRLYMLNSGMQVMGMIALAQTIRRTLGWAMRLRRGPVRLRRRPPASRLPMHSPDGGPAEHAIAPELQEA
jgi:hypothetical protein